MRARWWALGAMFGYAAVTALGPGAGRSGRDVRERPLPGDDVLERPTLSTTYSAVIDADPEAIWPWIVRIAQEHVRRAGVRESERPSGRIVHKVGIITFEPPQTLVMRSTSIAGGGRRRAPAQIDRAPAQIDWVWAFVLDDLGEGRTRVVLRLSSAARSWRAAGVRRFLAVPGEAVRVRRLMSGLARRATQTGAGAPGSPSRLEVVHREDAPD